MNRSKRQQDILNLLQDKGFVSVSALAKHFNVTTTSIRRDLTILEDNRFIIRSRGHAKIVGDRDYNVNPFTMRSEAHSEEKRRIAKAAAKLIMQNDSIILDSGTTIHEFALELDQNPIKGVSVVTNSMPAALALAKNYSATLTGGVLELENVALIGPDAEAYLNKVSSSKVIIGCTGASALGLTANSPFHVSIKKKMICCSRNIIALIDSSKFNVAGTHVFCEYQHISTIITVKTDSNEERIRELTANGVQVILA